MRVCICGQHMVWMIASAQPFKVQARSGSAERRTCQAVRSAHGCCCIVRVVTAN